MRGFLTMPILPSKPVLLFDFKCEAGHISEHLVKSDDKQVRCACGQLAHRIITPVRCKLDGFGDFPGEALKWARKHEKQRAIEAKRNA